MMGEKSIFEIIMLVCFGASWPFNVWKTYSHKSSKGKSFAFLWLIFIGYVAGILHKVYYLYDAVIYLYFFNAFIVGVDMSLAYYYYFSRDKKKNEAVE